jgi:toxin YoeB
LRNVEFHPRALADLSFWIREDRPTALRVVELLNDCVADPFRGIGKPEPLRQNLRGLWSRPITAEHRLVYGVTDERILVMQCRYHYE